MNSNFIKFLPWVVSWVCEWVFAGGLFFHCRCCCDCLDFFPLTVQKLCVLCPTSYVCECECEYWIEHRLSEKEKVKVPFEWAKLTKNKRRSLLLMMMMTTTTSATTTTATKNANWLNFKLHTLNTIISYSRSSFNSGPYKWSEEIKTFNSTTSGSSSTYVDMMKHSEPYTRNRVHENYEQRQRHNSNNYINDGVDCWREWTK